MTEPTDLTVTPAYRSTMERLETLKHITASGKEYWLAREIYPALGYTWEGFDGVITRAMDACSGVGIVPENHFRQTSTMVVLGSSAKRNVVNYFLSRAACYLIAINGDPSKPEVAAAQAISPFRHVEWRSGIKRNRRSAKISAGSSCGVG